MRKCPRSPRTSRSKPFVTIFYFEFAVYRADASLLEPATGTAAGLQDDSGVPVANPAVSGAINDSSLPEQLILRKGFFFSISSSLPLRLYRPRIRCDLERGERGDRRRV